MTSILHQIMELELAAEGLIFTYLAPINLIALARTAKFARYSGEKLMEIALQKVILHIGRAIYTKFSVVSYTEIDHGPGRFPSLIKGPTLEAKLIKNVEDVRSVLAVYGASIAISGSTVIQALHDVQWDNSDIDVYTEYFTDYNQIYSNIFNVANRIIPIEVVHCDTLYDAVLYQVDGMDEMTYAGHDIDKCDGCSVKKLTANCMGGYVKCPTVKEPIKSSLPYKEWAKINHIQSDVVEWHGSFHVFKIEQDKQKISDLIVCNKPIETIISAFDLSICMNMLKCHGDGKFSLRIKHFDDIVSHKMHIINVYGKESLRAKTQARVEKYNARGYTL